MAIEIGKDIIVKIGSTPVAGQREAGFTRTHEPIDSTVKTDFPNKAALGGWTSWEMTLGWAVDLSGNGFSALQSAVEDGTSVSVIFDQNNTTKTGTAFVTSFELNAPQDDVYTATVTLQGTGALS